MKTRSRVRFIIPATLVVTVMACASTPTPDNHKDGGGGSSGAGGSAGTGGGICQPVRVADAKDVTYECKDGRMCSTPDPEAIDAGGVYQICPGNSDCETLVGYDGGSMLGYC